MAGAEARSTGEEPAAETPPLPEFDVRCGPEADYAAPGAVVLDHDGITWHRDEDGLWLAELSKAQLAALPEGSVLFDAGTWRWERRNLTGGDPALRRDQDGVELGFALWVGAQQRWREIHVPVTRHATEQERLLACDAADPPQVDQAALDEMLREIGAPELCLGDEDEDGARPERLHEEVPLD